MVVTNVLLKGRVAFVTGAGSGIGRQICRCFAREGAFVAGGDVDEASVRVTLAHLKDPAHHLSVEMDVTKEDQVRAALAAIIERYSKPPCILVNSAGITRDNFMLKMPLEDFDKVIEVNLKGTFLVTKIFAEAMVENNVTGTIINISSITGKNGNIGQSNYAASKAGVLALSGTAAKELAKHNIRVNSIVPGFMDTPMTKTVPQKLKDRLLPFIPMGRFGKPEEVAEIATFLASDRSSYVTGAAFNVTGGLSL
jgi:17beta-estradiol 17-dehydrogenase/3alpha(17beta)-hydroxysteroid dehydrogenase (NAD+)